MYNYGQLQVAFDDGSVGWYEAGWGPMMSETAFFVKDVIGPKGSVSIVMAGRAPAGGSPTTSTATRKTNRIRVHHAELDADSGSRSPTSASTPTTSPTTTSSASASRRSC